MTQTPEGKVKAKIKALLVESGAYFHMPVPSGYGEDTLDFFGIRWPDGRGFVIEAKAPGEKPTARQRKRLREVYVTGGAAFVMDGAEEDLRLLKLWLMTPLMGQYSTAEKLIVTKWDIDREDEVLDK